jgi:putative ABC transport system ATP-binding protein
MIAHERAVLCENITKVYGSGPDEVHALRGVDLEIRAGELLMLVGPSGCGKTTLISIIAGILDPTAGRAVVFDHDLKQMPDREKVRFRGQSIGFVFQAFNLLPSLSAVENVAVPLLILGASRKTALARAHEVLKSVGLGERAKARPSQLSGGQQQRVAIARALVHEPKLIVCDEPTSSLDQETGQRVMQILRDVALAPDRALVIVTHDARTFGFADRIAKMNDGMIEKIVESAAHL